MEAWLSGVRVVLVTDRRRMGDGSVVAFGDAVARAVTSLPPGAALVQVREPDVDGGLLLQLVHAAIASGAVVMVHDRLDVALAAGAAGVQLPEGGLAIAEARTLVPEGFLIGETRRAPAALVDTWRLHDALTHYLRMVHDDPRDVRTWLKVGDVFARADAHPYALAAYRRVAHHYHEHGFFLKAVAVYKQILKLDASRGAVRRDLAALYRQLGLLQDAEEHERQRGEIAEPAPMADLLVLDLASIAAPAPALHAERMRLEARDAFAAPPPPRVHLVAAGGTADAAACRAAGADAVATAWIDNAAALA